MAKLTRISVVVLILVLSQLALSAAEKETLNKRYSGRFLVVMKEGLAVGICNVPAGQSRPLAPPELPVRIAAGRSDYQSQSGATATAAGCSTLDPEPLEIGEVLKVKKVWSRGDEFHISVQNVSPHRLEAGLDTNLEIGSADFRFKLSEPKALEASAQEIEKWVKPFQSAEEAAKFGSSASGAPAKQ